MTVLAAVAALALSGPGSGAAHAAAKKRPSLAAELRKLRLPPPWYASTRTSWSVNKPWKQGRKEIRRLLALGATKHHEAIKLTCLYRQKKDIGNGHEYPMYLFLGCEFAWAERALNEFIAAGHKDPHGLSQLASVYMHYGEYQRALAAMNVAMQNLPGNAWKTANKAVVNDVSGDIYALMGDAGRASQHYQKAMTLYPTSRQPYGREKLRSRVAKIRAKKEMLTLHTPKPGSLRDGNYAASIIGYVANVKTTVTVKDGRITDVKVAHRENIYGASVVEMPKRIIAAQSLKVDCVTAATVTSQSILAGAYEALKKAGMK